MKEIVINEKTLQYIGLPLTAFIFDGYWCGRSNFLCSSKSEKTNIELNSVEDCFCWMKYWTEAGDYVCGYVLDHSTRTVYYDKQQALDYLLKTSFPKRNEENFFENFIQKDFSI